MWSSRSPHYRWWRHIVNSGFYYNSNSWTYYTSAGKKRNGSAWLEPIMVQIQLPPLVMSLVCVDLDKGTITVYKNGVNLGVMYNNLPSNTNFTPLWVKLKNALTIQYTTLVNTPLSTPPTRGSWTSCCSSSRYVISRLISMLVGSYTGNSTHTDKIGFQPDLVWLKSRKVHFHIIWEIAFAARN